MRSRSVCLLWKDKIQGNPTHCNPIVKQMQIALNMKTNILILQFPKQISPFRPVCKTKLPKIKREFTIQLLKVVFDLAIERRIKTGILLYGVCVCACVCVCLFCVHIVMFPATWFPPLFGTHIKNWKTFDSKILEHRVAMWWCCGSCCCCCLIQTMTPYI